MITIYTHLKDFSRSSNIYYTEFYSIGEMPIFVVLLIVNTRISLITLCFSYSDIDRDAISARSPRRLSSLSFVDWYKKRLSTRLRIETKKKITLQATTGNYAKHQLVNSHKHLISSSTNFILLLLHDFFIHRFCRFFPGWTLQNQKSFSLARATSASKQLLRVQFHV